MMKSLTRPDDSNHLSWVGRKVEECPLDVALKKAINCIEFEARHLKLLRLDDHISNLRESTSLSAEEVIACLLDVLQQTMINFSAVNFAQLTFRYQATEDFYRRKNLLGKTYVFPPTNEITERLYGEVYSRVVHTIMYPFCLMTVDDLLESGKLTFLKIAEIKEVFSQGIRFANRVIAHLNEVAGADISSNANQHIKMIIENLKRYQRLFDMRHLMAEEFKMPVEELIVRLSSLVQTNTQKFHP